MKLSDFELTVMQLLWQCEQASAPELHQKITKKKDVTYSTVKTIIDRLEKKGAIIRSDQIGRTIFYQALMAATDIQKPMFRSMLSTLFGNNKKQLINHLFENENLNSSEIAYLEELIKKSKKHD